MAVSGRRLHRRSLLAAIDALCWILAFSGTTWLRFEGGKPPWGDALLMASLAAALFLSIGAGLRLYSGRHTIGSFDEAILLVLMAGLLGFALTVAQVFLSPRPLPISVPLPAAAIAAVLIVGTRTIARRSVERSRWAPGGTRALVVGAGEAGTRIVRDLMVDAHAPYDPIAFVDDDGGKRHYRVGPVRVEGTVSDIARLVKVRRIECVLLAAPAGGPTLVRRVSEETKELAVPTKSLPTLAELAGHGVGFRDLRDLELSDFLGRGQVETDLTQVSRLLTGRRVLVTGAGGSIGSELCRQIRAFQPTRLLMLDRDESALHALQVSLDQKGQLDSDDLVLADIRDEERVLEVFDSHRPEIVFHAAALKHLTLLQRNPDEGLKTNVQGTAHVLKAAATYNVGTFVNISTDKAADPSSALGESKQLAERLTTSYARADSGRYVSVRFGNVLGSRGSVLTAFAEQVRNESPLTVTHPDVTRYFMTVSEAVQLVLQGAALDDEGDVLVLDMGEPVRIMDMAQKMIELSGKDLEIVFTGLRPGEKMHEALVGQREVLQPTSHPAISQAPVDALDPQSVPLLRITVDGSLAIALPRERDSDVIDLAGRSEIRTGQ